MEPIKTFYWAKKQNFGDLLGSLVLKKFTKLDSTWANPADAQLVIIGSVLDQLPPDWSGIVAGAGKLHEKTKLILPNAKILAVRGPLTAKGLKGDFVSADPALLADELVGPVDKIYDLGLVPHWTDRTLEHEVKFLKYNPKIIRVNADPLQVIREIGQCRKIVSSSLHGIILADAFDIPRRIEISPRMLTHAHQEGGLFKWQDYQASLGKKLKIGVTEWLDHNIILERQYELFDMLEELKEILVNETR